MKLNKIIASALASIALSTAANAQSLVGYYMDAVPYINNYNPVFHPNCKVYVSLYDLYTNVNIPYGINDVFKYIPADGKDERYIIDLDKINSATHKNNNISAAFDIKPLNFGFRVGTGFVNVGIGVRTDVALNYSKDLLKLRKGTYYGQHEDNTIDLSGIGVNANAYTEFKVGYTKPILKNLELGVALKRLQGAANLRSKKTDLVLKTDNEMYDLNLKTSVKVDLAFTPSQVIVEYDEDGNIDDIDLEDDLGDLEAKDWVKRALKNGGWAVDLGGQYQMTKKLKFAASVVDLGFIRWHKNTVRFTNSDFEWTFDGLDAGSKLNDIDKVDDELSDRVKELSKFTSTNKTYYSSLNTKVYLSADYEVGKVLNVGVLYRGMLYNRHIQQTFTTSANFTLGRATQISVSHTFANWHANLIGAGIAQNIGPFQIYFMLDQISPAVWALNESSMSDRWIRKTNYVSFQTGLGFVFGRKYNFTPGLVEE